MARVKTTPKPRASRDPQAVPTRPAPENLGKELSTAIVFFNEAVAARVGMSSGEWRCYTLLAEHGPLAASRLAELSGFTTGAITGIVDRLQRTGFVRRQPNPEDRRSVIVHPLRRAEAERRTRPIFNSLGDAMNVIAANYTMKELAAIARYLSQTVEALRAETRKLRS
jgi:DNA-binding MarR family transcriptional regulator